MKAINKINDVITSVLKVICMILVALMTIVIFLQIFCRLFFTPLLWSEEASRIMMIWLIFLGSVLLYNMPRNGHIKVDLLDQAVPERFRVYLAFVVRVCVILIILVGIVGGFSLASTSFKVKSTALDVPFTFIYGVIPLSFALMIWFSFTQLLNRLLGKGEDPEEARQD